MDEVEIAVFLERRRREGKDGRPERAFDTICRQSREPKELFDRVARKRLDGGEGIEQADRRVNVRNVVDLGRDKRGELGRLADDQVRGPAPDQLRRRRQCSTGVDARETVTHHDLVRFTERRAPEPPEDGGGLDVGPLADGGELEAGPLH